jgi:hypothetical protein
LSIHLPRPAQKTLNACISLQLSAPRQVYE